MWIDNLIDMRARKGNPSCKLISEKCKVPERTVTRIFSRETDNPYIDTVIKIIKYGLEGSVEEVFADTKQVVGDDALIKLQGEAEIVAATNDLLSVENDALKKKDAEWTNRNASVARRRTKVRREVRFVRSQKT